MARAAYKFFGVISPPPVWGEAGRGVEAMTKKKNIISPPLTPPHACFRHFIESIITWRGKYCGALLYPGLKSWATILSSGSCRTHRRCNIEHSIFS